MSVGLIVGFLFGVAWGAIVKRGIRHTGHSRLGRLAEPRRLQLPNTTVVIPFDRRVEHLYPRITASDGRAVVRLTMGDE